MSNVKNWIKRNYARFCTVSTMHGYTELYNAKTWLFKSLWILIITGSIAVTGYQVNQAIYQYMYQSSYTNIAVATDDDVIYPPLKICLPHWIMWVNFTKADTYMPRNAALYALSYLADVYTSKDFNIERARYEFLAGYAKHNFTDLFDFYAHLALSPYSWINFEPFSESENRFKDYFTQLVHIDWSNTQSEYPILCYTISGSNIKMHFNEGHKNVTVGDDVSSNTLHLYLNPLNDLVFKSGTWDESQKNTTIQYMKDWQLKNYDYVIKEVNFTSFFNKMPYLVLVDGFGEEYTLVSINEEIVTFKVQASANVWKRTAANPCREGKFITSNKTCQKKCTNVYYINNPNELKYLNCPDDCSMLIQSFYGGNNKADLPKLCRNQFLYLTEEVNVIFHVLSNPSGTCDENAKSEAEKNISRQLLAECKKNCTSYCVNWKFQISKTTREESLLPNTELLFTQIYPQIIIEYPQQGEILINTEMSGQSWENFVSNIGGLLGIWTGASILSFVQVFYLCCCADFDEVFHKDVGGISAPENPVNIPAKPTTIQSRPRSWNSLYKDSAIRRRPK